MNLSDWVWSNVARTRPIAASNSSRRPQRVRRWLTGPRRFSTVRQPVLPLSRSAIYESWCESSRRCALVELQRIHLAEGTSISASRRSRPEASTRHPTNVRSLPLTRLRSQPSRLTSRFLLFEWTRLRPRRVDTTMRRIQGASTLRRPSHDVRRPIVRSTVRGRVTSGTLRI